MKPFLSKPSICVEQVGAGTIVSGTAQTLVLSNTEHGKYMRLFIMLCDNGSIIKHRVYTGTTHEDFIHYEPVVT